MLGYLSADIICSEKGTVFLELRSWKTVGFSEQIMSADKYPSIFSCQISTIVYLYHNQINARALIGLSAVGYCAGKPSEKSRCELRGTDNVQGQISDHIFAPNGDYCIYYPSNLFRNARSLGQSRVSKKI